MSNSVFNEPLTKIKNPDLTTGDHKHCSSVPLKVPRDQAYNCTQYNVRCDFSAKKNSAWSLFSAVALEHLGEKDDRQPKT